MFGKNQILHKDHGDGKILRVVKGSPFLTIQGEGPYSGRPAIFIRLHGCHLRCTFCDTDFDASDDPVVTMQDLVLQCEKFKSILVVLTGGEPLRQNIFPLCDALSQHGFMVQIETSGTFWIDDLEQVAEIVCSPKTPTIHPMILKHAMAFKYVISGSQKFGGGPLGYIPITATQPGARPAMLAAPRQDALVYLSPMDEQDDDRNEFNRELVGRLAIEFCLIAGIQLHKFLNLP